jgi:hypothetical protein
MQARRCALPCATAHGILADGRRCIVVALIVLLIVARPAMAAGRPSVAASKAFDEYVAGVEERIRYEESSPASFIVEPDGAAAVREAEGGRGAVVVSPRGSGSAEVAGGLIHHWIGSVFVPGASVAQVLSVLQDYDHLPRYYLPEVMSSRLISRDGDDFRIAMRLREHKVATVVMDSDYDVRYGRLDLDHQFSFSRSTRITEIGDAGGPREHALADTDSHGYLWRLNAYWRFARRGDGVVVQCEAVSLTRDVPAGLGWLVGPYVRAIPRESLQTTLGATRDALVARANSERVTAAEHR